MAGLFSSSLGLLTSTASPTVSPASMFTSDTTNFASHILATTTSFLLQSFSSVQASASSPATAALSNSSRNAPTTSAWIGIIVGALLGGLFIGFFSALLILWKRSKPFNKLELVSTRPNQKSFDPRGFTATPTHHASEPVVSNLDQFLALPTPEKVLVGELRSLGQLIEQHVENNYHLSPVSQSISSLSEALADVGLTSDSQKGIPGPMQVASMAINLKQRQVALQHIITRIIFASMSVDSIRNSLGKLSLLPASLTSVINHVAPCEKHLGNQKAVSMALTRWRQLSAFLLNPKRSERAPLEPDEDSLRPQVKEVTDALNNVLGAFVHQKSRISQETHLQEVVLECAKFGHTILSQPAEYAYLFGSENFEEVVVCPGLGKASNSHGVRCELEAIVAPETQKINPET